MKISFPVRAQRFVGREAELRHLRNELKVALRGNDRTVIISGDAGIGKTRLVETFARQSRAKSTTFTVRCRAHYVEPFSPFDELLGRVTLDPLNSTAIPINGLGEHRERRFQFYRTITSRLAALSSGKPAILAVEDLHWADSGTVDYLLHLTSSKSPEIALVIVTVRPQDGQIFEVARQSIASLRRSGATEISLESLSEDQARELISSLPRRFLSCLRPEELSSILRLAEGNPLCLEELTRGVLDGISLQRQVDVSHLAPTMYGVIRERLAGISKEARKVLEIAAVCGSNFSASLISEVTGDSMTSVAASIRVGLQKRLIVPAPANSEFTFRHALIREIVHNEISPHAIPRYHAALAGTLEKRGANPGILAHHWFAADEFARAAKAFSLAGDVAFSKTAWAHAANSFEKALQIESDPLSRASLKFRLGRCLFYSADRATDAEAVLQSAADEFANLTQNDDAASALLLLSRVKARQMKYEEAQEATRRIISLRPSVSPRMSAAAFTQIANAERRRGDLVASASALEVAGRELEEDCQDSLFLELRATVNDWRGRTTEADRDYKKAAARAAATGSDAALAVRLNNAANGLFYAGRLKEALAIAQESLSVASRSGCREEQALSRLTLSEILRGAGRLLEAREQLQNACREPAAYAAIAAQYYGLGCELGVYLDDSSLIAQLPRMYSLDEILHSQATELITSFAMGRALLLNIQGRPDEARDTIEQSMLELRSVFFGGPDLVLSVARYAGAHVQAKARSLLETDARQCRLLRYSLHLFDAIVARRKRRAAKAREIARVAKRGFNELGYKLLELMAADAMGDKREATRLAISMGMPSNVWARHSSRVAQMRHDPLTSRQLQIAQSAAAGLRNREIASAFGLSEKTVERHLMAVLSALDLRSRWQIADALERRRIALH